MRNTLRLLPTLLRRDPAASARALVLCVAGTTVAVAIATIILAAYGGLERRDERISWRDVDSAETAEPTTAMRRSMDFLNGDRVTVIELAALDPNAAPDTLAVPPGLDRVPAPGHSAVSPAMADRLEALSSEAAQRFGRRSAIIGDDALATPNELVVVKGVTAEQLPLGDNGRGVAGQATGSPDDTVAISAYSTTSNDIDIEMYRYLALVAITLVVVPAVLLVGSSARLTAATREQRLAALRLAGATPGGVRAMTAAETTLGAGAGAVMGIVLGSVTAPGLRSIQLGGDSWFGGDLTISFGRALLIGVVSVLVSVAAAIVSLRRVAASPLGVARSTNAQGVRAVRLLALIGAGIAMAVLSSNAADGGAIVAMIAGFGIVIASISLVGPWITSLVGRLLVRSSRKPTTLLAGRAIQNDPVGAYRVVAAVVFAGLAAGFIAGALPTADALEATFVIEASGESALYTQVPGQLFDQAQAAGAAVTDRYPGTIVEHSPVESDWPLEEQIITFAVGLPQGADIETVRSIGATYLGGHPMVESTDDLWGDRVLVGDLQRGASVVLIFALLLAAASSTLAAAADIMDRRIQIARLTLAGVTTTVLDRARRWQSTSVLVAATVGAVGVGVSCSFAMMAGFGAGDALVGPNALWIAAAVGAALCVGMCSALVTRPLLERTAHNAVAISGGS